MKELGCTSALFAFFVASAALAAAPVDKARFDLTYTVRPGSELVYRLDEVRTDRTAHTSLTTSAHSVLAVSSAGEAGRLDLTLERHRLRGEASPLEGIRTGFSLFPASSSGVAQLIASYFPSPVDKPVAVGQSWKAPFIPPSLGRLRVVTGSSEARYTLERVVRTHSGEIAEVGAAADLSFDRAILYGSALGVGRPHLPAIRAEPGSIAYEAGLRSGDRLVRVSGKRVATWEEAAAIAVDGSLEVEIFFEGDGEARGLKRRARNSFVTSLPVGLKEAGALPLGLQVPDSFEPLVGQVEDGSPAAAAGIAVGDVIARLGAAKIADWEDLERFLAVIPPGTELAVEKIPRGADLPTVSLVRTGQRQLHSFSAAGRFTGFFTVNLSSHELLEATWRSDDLLITITLDQESIKVRTELEGRLSLTGRRRLD